MVVTRVTVLPAADARTFPARVVATSNARYVLGVIALALCCAVAAAGTIWLSGRTAARPAVNPLTRDHGPAGVAAAYGHPLDCLSITILSTSRTYARADFNHLRSCGRYTGYPTAIFHYDLGRWRPVLDAVSYRCPIGSLPSAVATALDVCEQPGGSSPAVHR